MMRAFVKDGRVVGIYGEGDYGAPKDSHVDEVVELTRETGYPKLNYCWDGKTFYQSSVEPRVVSLDEVKAVALKVVDLEAMSMQESLLGDNKYQMTIYASKAVDGKAWQLKIYGEDVSAYKWIDAEIKAVGGTPDSVAAKFVSLSNTLNARLAEIEQVRVFGKSSIRSAEDVAAVREAKVQTLSDFAELKALY